METTAPQKRRRYSESDQAEALATLEANGGNISQTARELDIPHETLRQWVTGIVSAPAPALREQKKRELADRYEGLLNRALDTVDAKVDQMSASAAVMAAAIMTDKMLLLRGEATNITEHRDDSREEALRERYGRLTSARSAPPPTPISYVVSPPTTPAPILADCSTPPSEPLGIPAYSEGLRTSAQPETDLTCDLPGVNPSIDRAPALGEPNAGASVESGTRRGPAVVNPS